MVWIEDKSVGLVCPYFADVFEGCEALATASRDDIRYIYSTFPIVAQHERDKWDCITLKFDWPAPIASRAMILYA